MNKPKLIYVAVALLTKVFNPRSESSERNNADLESIKTVGLKTPLEVCPLNADIYQNGQLVEVLSGHRRTALLKAWQTLDPVGFAQGFSIVDGKEVPFSKGIPVYMYENLTTEEKEDVRNDHSAIKNLLIGEFIVSLVHEAKANINPKALYEGERLSEAWTAVQVKLIQKHWNNFVTYSEADAKAIRRYEDTLNGACPIAKPPDYATNVAAAKTHDARVHDWTLNNKAEANRQLIELSRGFFQKVQRLAELPEPVLTLFKARIDGMETQAELRAYLAEKKATIPAFHTGNFPDVAGRNLSGSTKAINRLHSAWIKDGRTQGEEYQKTWVSLATETKEKTKDNKNPKAMTGKALGEVADTMQSSGVKQLLAKARGLEANPEAINKADQVLAGLDAIEANGNQTLAEIVASDAIAGAMTLAAFLRSKAPKKENTAPVA